MNTGIREAAAQLAVESLKKETHFESGCLRSTMALPISSVRDIGKLDPIYNILNSGGVVNSLARRFEHYAAKWKHKSTIEDLYVFPENTNTDIPDGIIDVAPPILINENVQAVDSFLARLKADCDDVENDSIRQVYILHGPRGCGKTFFLNYLATSRRRFFHENKICWVRVNLTRKWSWSVEARLYHQTCHIVYEKYLNCDGTSDSQTVKNNDSDPPRISDFVEYLANCDVNDNCELVSRIVEGLKNLKLLSEMKKSDNTNPNLQQMFEHVVQFMRQQGFRFVFVLDGLDAQLPVDQDEERFKAAIEDTWELLKRPNVGGVWIFCQRTESLLEFKSILERPPKYNPIELKLLLPPAINVVRSRFRSMSNGPLGNKFDESAWQGLALLFEYFLASGLDHTLRNAARNKERADLSESEARERASNAINLFFDVCEGNYRKFLAVLRLCLVRLLVAICEREQIPSIEKGKNGGRYSDGLLKYLASISPGRWNFPVIDSFARELSNVSTSLVRSPVLKLIGWRSHEVMIAIVHGVHLCHKLPFRFQIDDNALVETKYVEFLGPRSDQSPGFFRNSAFYPNLFNWPTALQDDEPNEATTAFLPFLQLTLLFFLEREFLAETARIYYRVCKKQGVSKQILLATLTNLWFYGLVWREPSVEGIGYRYGLSLAGECLREDLWNNETYLVGVTETTPFPDVNADKIAKLLDDMLSQDSLTRALIRIRMAFVQIEFLSYCFRKIEDKKWLNFETKKMLARMEASLCGFVYRMAGSVVRYVGSHEIPQHVLHPQLFTRLLMGEGNLSTAVNLIKSRADKIVKESRVQNRELAVWRSEKKLLMKNQ